MGICGCELMCVYVLVYVFVNIVYTESAEEIPSSDEGVDGGQRGAVM